MMQSRLFYAILSTAFLFSSFVSSQKMRGGLPGAHVERDEQHRNLGWLYDLVKKTTKAKKKPQTDAPTLVSTSIAPTKPQTDAPTLVSTSIAPTIAPPPSTAPNAAPTAAPTVL